MKVLSVTHTNREGQVMREQSKQDEKNQHWGRERCGKENSWKNTSYNCKSFVLVSASDHADNVSIFSNFISRFSFLLHPHSLSFYLSLTLYLSHSFNISTIYSFPSFYLYLNTRSRVKVFVEIHHLPSELEKRTRYWEKREFICRQRTEDRHHERGWGESSRQATKGNINTWDQILK